MAVSQWAGRRYGTQRISRCEWKILLNSENLSLTVEIRAAQIKLSRKIRMAMAFPNKANTLPTSVPSHPHNNCAISHFNYQAWSDVDVVRSHAAVRIWHAPSQRGSNNIHQKRFPFVKIFTFAFTPTLRSPGHQTHSANDGSAFLSILKKPCILFLIVRHSSTINNFFFYRMDKLLSLPIFVKYKIKMFSIIFHYCWKLHWLQILTLLRKTPKMNKYWKKCRK